MMVARVIGRAVASIKHKSLCATKLALVQPLNSMTQEPLLVPDRLGASVGDLVIITSDGKGAREFLQNDTTPVRWTLVGIVDNEGAACFG